MKTEWVVDRLEGDQVILIATDKTSLIFPANKLPVDVHEGQVLYFEISTSVITEQKSKETAKEILNEILNTN
jgi:hypothetical protein